jgi:hypothetical protein
MVMAGFTEQTVGAEDWRASLLRSKAELDAGQTAPLLPILEQLRASADRLANDARPHGSPEKS